MSNKSLKRKILVFLKKLRPIFVVLFSIGIVLSSLFISAEYFLQKFIKPADNNDPSPIEIVIPEGASASKIAGILFNARGYNEKGLIANASSFKIYVDFIGKANSLQAGTYVLSRNMSIKEIVDILVGGPNDRQ